MNHIDTFPNLYIENETYVKINWETSDLNIKLKQIESSYQNYEQIIENGHKLFMNYQNDYNLFKNHFKKLVESI